jgi:Tol biopolymer transport system component
LLDQVRVSPDGQQVAAGVLGDLHAVWIYPLAGGTPIRLDTDSSDEHAPSWSPDGNWIACRRVTSEGWVIVKVPVGGGRAVRLAESDPGGVFYAGPTDWSPAGAWIAYAQADALRLVSPDGTSRRVLAGPRPAAFRFSRDGSRLFAVRRDRDQRWELATYDVATGREARIVTLPLSTSATIQGMSLSADESRIILGSGTPTSDIWLLEDFAKPESRWARWFRR